MILWCFPLAPRFSLGAATGRLLLSKRGPTDIRVLGRRLAATVERPRAKLEFALRMTG
jgi:hypothetical protein